MISATIAGRVKTAPIGTGLTVMERGHGVEEMGGVAHAQLDALGGFVHCSAGVPHGRNRMPVP